MPKLSTFATEFVGVTEHLLDEKLGLHIKDNLAVDKKMLCELLDSNDYEESAEKLKTWKRLHWIQTDQKHVTKSVYLAVTKSFKRMVVIDLSVYKTLANLV